MYLKRLSSYSYGLWRIETNNALLIRSGFCLDRAIISLLDHLLDFGSEKDMILVKTPSRASKNYTLGIVLYCTSSLVMFWGLCSSFVWAGSFFHPFTIHSFAVLHNAAVTFPVRIKSFYQLKLWSKHHFIWMYGHNNWNHNATASY